MARPEENVAAYAALMSQLQAQMLATRENARAMVRNAGQAREYRLSTPEWEATEWAAGRLLADLQAIRPPVVPEDPERGQGTLEEAITEMSIADMQASCHHALISKSGTPGEAPILTCSRCGATLQTGSGTGLTALAPQAGDNPVDEVPSIQSGQKYPHAKGPGCWCNPVVRHREGQTFVKHRATT